MSAPLVSIIIPTRNSLYAKCPWSTSFQKPDFFRVWFRHYGARWCPVLVLGFDDHGSLAALIPLAAADGVVTGVGAHQAEYHGWLSGGDCPSDFLKDAVGEILKTFRDMTCGCAICRQAYRCKQ